VAAGFTRLALPPGWWAATRARRRLVGLPAHRLIITACALGGACAGLAGGIEVAAVHTAANASLIAGWATPASWSFVARHNPLAIIPVAILFGGFGAAGSLLQRRMGLPDASVQVLQGFAFVLILASRGAGAGRAAAQAAAVPHPRAAGPMPATEPARDRSMTGTPGSTCCWRAGRRHPGGHALPLRQPGRVPDREGRPHQPGPGRRAGALGDGRLRRSYLSGSPWLGVLAAGCQRCAAGQLHGLLCSLPRVNDVATGIALMLLGAGLAFYLGKPLIQPQAPQIPAMALGGWSESPCGAGRAGSTRCSRWVWCWRCCWAGPLPTRAGG
jgi:ABC-type uncharacterized transport system permease subunit